VMVIVPGKPDWFWIHCVWLKAPRPGGPLMVMEKVWVALAMVASLIVTLPEEKVPGTVGVPAKTIWPLLTVAVRPGGNPDCAKTE
jgi:hypothetical protein